jgi:hypothetical protein
MTPLVVSHPLYVDRFAVGKEKARLVGGLAFFSLYLV